MWSVGNRPLSVVCPEAERGKHRGTRQPEMQKVADAADISVLFFQLVLIFEPFWVIFG